MHLISHLAYQTVHIPRFNWNVGYTIVQMDGVPIQVLSLIDMTHRLLAECDKRLRKALQGLWFPDFHERVLACTRLNDTDNWLRDDLRNMTPGYSFVYDKRNKFQEYEHLLLAALLDDENNPEIASRLSMRHADGTVHIKRSERPVCCSREPV
jgi:hypothetical protein